MSSSLKKPFGSPPREFFSLKRPGCLPQGFAVMSEENFCLGVKIMLQQVGDTHRHFEMFGVKHCCTSFSEHVQKSGDRTSLLLNSEEEVEKSEVSRPS